MAVIIQNSLNRKIDVTILQDAANSALKSEGASNAEVSILITDDEEIHAMNLQYRGIDKATDVLSFAQRDDAPDSQFYLSEVEEEVLGDIVISLETAERQATLHEVTLNQELELLTVHGVLHLLGYEDATEAGMLKMQAIERSLGVRE